MTGDIIISPVLPSIAVSESISPRNRDSIFFSVPTLFEIIGLAITILGLLVAIRQIRKTKKSADAAKDAAESMQGEIKKNVALTDISTCTRLIDQIKNFLLDQKFESARLRITDLHTCLVQLRHVDKHGPNLKIPLTQLGIIETSLEKHILDADHEVNVLRFNEQLSKIAKELNDWLGTLKYTAPEGGRNDT
ncbi:MAG: hypothetical protein KA801_11265 [Syntrophorhabdaceae bacterium]|nr:hypothetical protein [Syntrophorhabdaceae bacterium]